MFAIGIVAHHTRATMTDQLAQQTRPAYVSVDTGHLGANTNHRQVWAHLAGLNTTWSVVLEDDAQPVDDFRQHLTHALEAAPTPIVSLYLGRQRPPQYQQAITDALAKADANNAHWITSTQLMHAVGVAIWTRHIPDMLHNLRPYLPFDENIGRWARRCGYPIAYTIPSLVDHADTPTLIAHPDQAERPPGRTAWRTGTNPDWNTTTVELQ